MIRSVNVTSSISRSAGGLYESVRRLVQELQLLDVEVIVLGTEDHFTKKDVGAWSPVYVYAVKPVGPQQFGYSGKFRHYLDGYQPDILHTHGIWNYASYVTWKYALENKTPYMVSPHGMLDPWAVRNSYWKKVIAHYLYEGKHLHGATCMRALCASEAESFRKYGLKNPICVIPNGIDLPEEGDPTKPETGNLKPEVGGIKTMLFLGRIHPKKGLMNAIKAFAEILKDKGKKSESVPWRFVIAGWDQGGHEAELKKLCEVLGLSVESRGSRVERQQIGADVVFWGPAFGEEKKALLRSSDAFILPSFSEGLPMAVLEAWAYGLPVVMTPECNLPEGYAADAAIRIEANPASIARGLSELFSMSDTDLSAMGERGNDLVRERFTWKKVAQQLKDVYEWMLGGGNAPECVLKSH